MARASASKLLVHVISAGLSAALDQATKDGCAIVAAIVGPSGRLLGLLGNPEAFLASKDYAVSKAWTAASFEMPTSGFAQLLATMDQSTREGLLAHPKTTALSGGVPVIIEGDLHCAVGVSGGSGEQDERCARAAEAAILKTMITD